MTLKENVRKIKLLHFKNYHEASVIKTRERRWTCTGRRDGKRSSGMEPECAVDRSRLDGEENLYKKSAGIIIHPHGKYKPHLSPHTVHKNRRF